MIGKHPILDDDGLNQLMLSAGHAIFLRIEWDTKHRLAPPMQFVKYVHLYTNLVKVEVARERVHADVEIARLQHQGVKAQAEADFRKLHPFAETDPDAHYGRKPDGTPNTRDEFIDAISGPIRKLWGLPPRPPRGPNDHFPGKSGAGVTQRLWPPPVRKDQGGTGRLGWPIPPQIHYQPPSPTGRTKCGWPVRSPTAAGEDGAVGWPRFSEPGGAISPGTESVSSSVKCQGGVTGQPLCNEGRTEGLPTPSSAAQPVPRVADDLPEEPAGEGTGTTCSSVSDAPSDPDQSRDREGADPAPAPDHDSSTTTRPKSRFEPDDYEEWPEKEIPTEGAGSAPMFTHHPILDYESYGKMILGAGREIFLRIETETNGETLKPEEFIAYGRAYLEMVKLDLAREKIRADVEIAKLKAGVAEIKKNARRDPNARDPEAPYGRKLDGTPLTNDEWLTNCEEALFDCYGLKLDLHEMSRPDFHQPPPTPEMYLSEKHAYPDRHGPWDDKPANDWDDEPEVESAATPTRDESMAAPSRGQATDDSAPSDDQAADRTGRPSLPVPPETPPPRKAKKSGGFHPKPQNPWAFPGAW